MTYTQTTSRFGNLTRKYPDFKSGEADAEAAQPEQALAMEADFKISGN